MTENEIAQIVFKKGLSVHRKLGPGLLESVYEECLTHELRKEGLNVDRQTTIPIRYDDIELKAGFRADLIINGKLLVELKSVESIKSIHLAQTITYLRLTNIKLGLLINFNVSLFKNGFQRLANGM